MIVYKTESSDFQLLEFKLTAANKQDRQLLTKPWDGIKNTYIRSVDTLILQILNVNSFQRKLLNWLLLLIL